MFYKYPKAKYQFRMSAIIYIVVIFNLYRKWCILQILIKGEEQVCQTLWDCTHSSLNKELTKSSYHLIYELCLFPCFGSHFFYYKYHSILCFWWECILSYFPISVKVNVKYYKMTCKSIYSDTHRFQYQVLTGWTWASLPTTDSWAYRLKKNMATFVYISGTDIMVTYSQFLIFPIVLSYKVTMNIEIANTEALILGEMRG